MRPEYRRRIPRLPNYPIKLKGGPDKGAPLPAPQPGFEVRKVGENPDGSLILQNVQKPPYSERIGKWQR